MTQSLSPTAQAVLDAYRNTNTMMDGPNTAAVIRALVERTLPEEFTPRSMQGVQVALINERRRIRRAQLAVANELESSS